MTLQEAVTLLENHNKWRRGDETLEMAEPKDLGMAIELIVEHFNTKECPFYPTMNTSSATICGACGKEKFEHNL